MDIRVVNQDRDFYNLKECWSGLVQKMDKAQPFQTWEWNYYWWKVFGSGKELFLMLAFENGELYGIAPLFKKGRNVFFIGGSDCDFGDFIILKNSYSIIGEFYKQLTIIEPDVIHFKEMPANSPNYHILLNIIQENNFITFRTTGVPFIPINKHKNRQEYYKSLSSNFKRQLNKAQRAISDEYFFDENTLPDHRWVQRMKRLFIKRQKERAGRGNFDSLIPLMDELYNSGMIRVTSIRSKDRIISFTIDFIFKNSFYNWILVIDSDFDKIGHLNFMYNINYCFGQGMYEFNLLRGDYPFKMRWRPEIYSNYDVLIFRTKLLKCWYLLRRYARRLLKKIVYSNRVLINIWRRLSKSNLVR